MEDRNHQKHFSSLFLLRAAPRFEGQKFDMIRVDWRDDRAATGNCVMSKQWTPKSGECQRQTVRRLEELLFSYAVKQKAEE